MLIIRQIVNKMPIRQCQRIENMVAQILPPGPPAAKNIVQTLQLMRQFETDLLGYTSRNFAQYGGIWKIEAGGEIQYMISEPDLIQEVTVKQADKFHKSPDYVN